MPLTTKLEDLCTAIVDCPHSTPKWTDNGIVVLRNANIKGGRLNLSDASFTDTEHYLDRIRRAVPEPGDLVITREAPMGEVCMIPPGLQCCLGQRMVLLKPDATKVHPRYLLFALQSRHVQNQILASEGTGSTVSNLRIPLLRTLSVPMLDFASQEAVATILGALDDKIELNRRMSETLEEIARTLCDRWLQDMAYVKSGDSRELGTGATFADVAHEHKDKWLPVKDEVVDHHSLPAFDAGLQPVREHSSSIKSAKTLVPKGAILVSRLNPRIPRVWLTDVSDVVPAVASTEFLVATPKEPFGRSYLYLLASSSAFQRTLVSMATGTSGSHQRVRPASVMGLTVPTAPPTELGKLEVTLGPLLDRVIVARRESKTLTNLRDALLPKLISGELRIPDAEQLVSEVA